MAELGGEVDLQEPRLFLASRSAGKPLGMTGYSAGPEWRRKSSLLDKLPGDPDAAGPWTIF